MWGGLLAIFVSTGAWAQGAARPTVHAVRTHAPVELDGKLDEADWKAAPAFSDFVDAYPTPGAKPSQRTEVRVLYDDSNLYVGVICFDTQPERIQRQLGRRDNIPSSDLVIVDVDPQHDRRSAQAFFSNAAGVQQDQILFDDVNGNTSWNAVWDSAVASRPDGWSVEFELPLHLFRFSDASFQTWGFQVHREIPRTHEQMDLAFMPRSANAFVSLFGDLTGLRDLHPQRDLELTPYVASRASLRPRYESDARPRPRLFDPSLDMGLYLKASLGSSLTLDAAINPEFGEIEPDALQLNLSTHELFFPEMRPFFTQGLELFDSTVAGLSDQRLFYSRRIGLDAPLLGAAKLTGTVRDGLSMSVLDAVVTGVGDPAKQPFAYGDDADTDRAPLDRRFQFHWQRPFHFGLNNELPGERPVTANFLAVVARQKFDNASSVGATVTSRAPLSDRCYRSDFTSEAAYLAADCEAAGGNAAGIDFNLRSESGDWATIGQLTASQRLGGPSGGETLDDGTVLHAGDWGFGGYVRMGKLGGEPWQFDVSYQLETPTLDLNASGYQADSNRHQLAENLRYTRPSGSGSLHSYSTWFNLSQSWSADGRGLPLYAKSAYGADVTLPNYLYLGAEVGLEQAHYELREIPQTGYAFQRNDDLYLVIFGNTDSRNALQVGWNLVGYTLFDVPASSELGKKVDVWGRLRPTDNLETYLELASNWNPQGLRYVDTLDDTHFVFAPQHPWFGSVTLRQLWVLSPTLTLQAYAQLFSAYAHYGPFFQGSPEADGRVTRAGLTPMAAFNGDDPDFHDAALNVSVVGRWEYRLGSTLFLVYSRTQQALPFAEGRSPRTYFPENLAHGRTDDTFLVKWSYWWDV
jgi:hypothetical protein